MMMRPRFVFIAWMLVAGSACARSAAQTPAPTTGLKVEKLVDSLGLLEGPIWHPDGYLLFVDVSGSRIHRWSPSGGLAIVKDSTGRANGIAIDASGNLILAQRDRMVSRLSRDGKLTLLAEQFEGKRLNSPNDLAMRSDGTVYFTDPTFGVRPNQAELGFKGVFRLHPDGRLEVLARDFNMPNGIGFSPDQKRLYVNDSGEHHMRVFDVAADGTLRNGRIFAVIKDSTLTGDPDGLEVDSQGNVYTAGPGGVWVFAPDGTLMRRIEIPVEHTTNLAFGDDGERTLYVTAVARVPGGFSGKLYRVQLR